MSVGLVSMLLNLSTRQSRGGVGVLKNFAVDGLWTFIVKLLVFRDGLFNLVGRVVSGDFAGLVFCVFSDASQCIYP